MLNTKLLPSIQESNLPEPIHLDDSASCHRTNKVKEWHEQQGIQKIDWPGNSPDLNLIENIWGYMKQIIRKRTIRNKKSLIENIHQIWQNEIPDSLVQNLCQSMPRRLQCVITNKGGNTKY